MTGREELQLPRNGERIRRSIDDEIAAHLEQRAEELTGQGRTWEEAMREARREFGDVDAARTELGRIDRWSARRDRLIELVLLTATDLRRTIRGLARRPGFALAACTTLALGIGANAAIFGLVDRLLLSPPPHILDADQVFKLRYDTQNRGGGRISWVRASYPAYEQLSRAQTGFAGLAGYIETELTFAAGSQLDELAVAAVTPTYFPLLGTTPSLGRFPGGEKFAEADERAIVLSHAFWTSRFGERPDVLGEAVRLGEHRYTVVGIAPRDFRGDGVEPVDAWIPLVASTPGIPSEWATAADWRLLFVVGRLASGFTPGEASRQSSVIYRSALMDTRAPDSTAVVQVNRLAPGYDSHNAEITTEAKVALWLQGVSLLVLIVALANVTNLLLLRSIERRRETAVRLALGINRMGLIRYLSLESLTLALAGGAGAVLLTQWLGPTLWAVILPAGAATAGAPSRLGWVAAGVAAACALVMTLVPAVFLRFTSDSDVLRAGGRAATRRGTVTGEALVLVQVALTVVLLVGAGLFVRSILRLGDIDLGMATDRVVAVRMNPDPSIREQSVREAVFATITDAVRGLPGVEAAGMSQTGPFLPSMSQSVFLPGHEELPGVGPERLGYPTFFAVTPEFFEAVGLKILEGRSITTADDSNAAPVMLVDATMASTFWPGEAAIGRCMRLGADTMPCTTVVGVVSDSKRFLVQPNHSLRYYLPLAQSPYQPDQRFLLVRTPQSPSAMIHPVRTAASEAGGARAYVDVFPLNDLLDPYTRQWRLGMAAFVTFGVLATVIATIGLYGVISFGIANREREFGIRRALGEPTGRLLGSVMLGAALRSGVGLLAGGLLSLLLARRLHDLLYQPAVADAVVFLASVAVVMTATLVASAAPSWRAVRVDPVSALRAE